MKTLPLSLALLAALALLAQDGPESVTRGTKRFDRKVLVSGLAGPWELAWGPDSLLWITERTGKRVTRVDPATGARHVAITIDEVSAPGGQDGLLGMTSSPTATTLRRLHLRRQSQGPRPHRRRSSQPLPLPVRQNRPPDLHRLRWKALAAHDPRQRTARRR